MDALLRLLACPVTGDTDWTLDGDLLRTGAGTVYPIVAGIPRLLPPDLLGPFLREVYPDVLSRHPEVAAQVAGTADPEPAVMETLRAYNRQHVDLADDEQLTEDWRATWNRFQPGLPPEALAGETVLDVGCGEGRHTSVVGAHAGTIVGLDLSCGVEVARRRDARPTSFYVQGDLRRPPFRPGAFDAMYSNGVLHHTPDPAASFASAASLVRPGGRVSVWVYGLDEMRWTYRVSHLTWLRPVTNRLPRAAQEAVAAALTGVAELSLWTPARTLRRVGLASVADRIPYHDAADKDWRYKHRRMFDRLNPPITFYIDRDELGRWLEGFEQVEIINADGQGWTGRGRKSR